MEKENNYTKVWIIVGAAVLIWAFFMWNEYNMLETMEENVNRIEIIQQNKVLIEKRDSVSKNLLKISEENAKISDQLTKSITNEKLIIKDADYDSMSKFILEYRPE
jgi:hypothetical protein